MPALKRIAVMLSESDWIDVNAMAKEHYRTLSSEGKFMFDRALMAEFHQWGDDNP